MTVTQLNTTTWTLLASAVSTCVVQISGTDAEITIAAALPAATEAGFAVPSGIPLSVPGIADLGGNVYAKGSGAARHLSA